MDLSLLENKLRGLVFDLLKCDMRFGLQKCSRLEVRSGACREVRHGRRASPTHAAAVREADLPGPPSPTLGQGAGPRRLRVLVLFEVMHADLKPDNILMTLSKARLTYFLSYFLLTCVLTYLLRAIFSWALRLRSRSATLAVPWTRRSLCAPRICSHATIGRPRLCWEWPTTCRSICGAQVLSHVLDRFCFT